MGIMLIPFLNGLVLVVLVIVLVKDVETKQSHPLLNKMKEKNLTKEKEQMLMIQFLKIMHIQVNIKELLLVIYLLKEKKKERSTSSLLRSSSSFDYIPISECKEKRIAELCRKNEQCLDYIARTERLLTLIRSEQGRIHGELESITKLDTTKTIIMKNSTTTNASTSNSPECDSSEASSDIDPSSPLDEEFDTGFVNSANSSLESILEQHKSLVSV